MTMMTKIQVQSTPDQIAAGIKWERVKIHHGVLTEEFDQAVIHTFAMLVRDDGAWSIHEIQRTGTPGMVMVQGESADASAARRDATLALLGACEGAEFFFYAKQTLSLTARWDVVKVCNETARIIRDSAINLTSEDPA